MNTCKTCQYWGDILQSSPMTDHHECNNKKLESSSSDGLDPNWDYNYGLTTGPDFGCIHWTEKK